MINLVINFKIRLSLIVFTKGGFIMTDMKYIEFKFIWDYNRGKTIVKNLKTLEFLMNSQKSEILFNKFILIQAMAIIEFVFYDFILRLSEERNERDLRVYNLDRDQIQDIRTISSLDDKFQNSVKFLERYKLLPSANIYQELRDLWSMRNGVHLEVNETRRKLTDESQEHNICYKKWAKNALYHLGFIINFFQVNHPRTEGRWLRRKFFTTQEFYFFDFSTYRPFE